MKYHVKVNIFKVIYIILASTHISGCGVIAKPIAEAIRGVPYHNPNYVVSTECAKDIIRVIIADSGTGFNSFDDGVAQIRNLAQMIIKKNNSIADTLIFYTINTDNEYHYFFSKSGNHLKMVLYKYIEKDITYKNTIAGYEIHHLTSCKVRK